LNIKYIIILSFFYHRYIAGVAAMTTVSPDFSVALNYFEQAKSMIDAFREFPDFEVCNFLVIISTCNPANNLLFVAVFVCVLSAVGRSNG
jgi:hypothetical protein